MKIGHEGKVAIVTGGSAGIGLAIARRLVDAGAEVLITGRRRPALEAAAGALGDRCRWRVCHAADPEETDRCVSWTLDTLGGVDLLVNNAGAALQWGPSIAVDASMAAKMAEVNQWAPLRWIQAVWDASMRQRGGVVLNITSVGGLLPVPNTGYYNATKAALGLLTRQLGAELAPRVRVNAIAPGTVQTEMSASLVEDQRDRILRGIPMGRLGTPEDIAAAASFLLSDQADWITGQVLAVDGGASQVSGHDDHP